MMTKHQLPLEDLVPLTRNQEMILTALLDGALHGYGIMKKAEEVWKKNIPAATLYRDLDRFLSNGIIKECDRPTNAPKEKRQSKVPRQYYTITGRGVRLLDLGFYTRHDLVLTQQRGIAERLGVQT